MRAMPPPPHLHSNEDSSSFKPVLFLVSAPNWRDMHVYRGRAQYEDVNLLAFVF